MPQKSRLERTPQKTPNREAMNQAPLDLASISSPQRPSQLFAGVPTQQTSNSIPTPPTQRQRFPTILC